MKRVPSLEYNGGDEAWYGVTLHLQQIEDDGNGRKNVLRIHYEGFSDDFDERLAVEDFQNVQEFKAKFRLSSNQLQDKYCRKVTDGLIVCASDSADGQDSKYFDARVLQVCWSKHLSVDGEEQCMCTYEILWLAGPRVGERTTIHCENIRLLQFGSIQRHPVVKEFLQMIQENIDCRLQSGGRNPLKEKVSNLEESSSKLDNPHLDNMTAGKENQSINQLDDGCVGHRFLMSGKGEQGELEHTANEDVRNCNLRSNSLASKDERSRTLEEICDQRSKAEGAKSSCFGQDLPFYSKHFKETGSAQPDREVSSAECCKLVDESLLPIIDCALDSERSSSLSEEKQNRNIVEHCNFEANARKSILCSEEGLLQRLFAYDNEPGNLTQSGDDIGLESNFLNCPDTDSNLYFPNQANRDTESAIRKEEGTVLKSDTLPFGSYLPSDIKNVKYEDSLVSRNEVPVVSGAPFTISGGKLFEGDDSTLMKMEERDSLLDLNALPTHWQLIQQVIPTSTAGIAKDPSEGKEVKDADVYIQDEDCFILGERRPERFTAAGSFSVFDTIENMDHKNLGKPCSPVGFPASMIPFSGGESHDVFGESLNAKKEGKSHFEIADKSDCLSLNKHHSAVNGHGIKRHSSFLAIENENGDFECGAESARGDLTTWKHGKIWGITPNDRIVKACTASLWGRGKRSKHRENEMFDSEHYVQSHKQIVEYGQGLDILTSPIKDSVGLDALSSDYLKTSHLEHHKIKQLSLDSCDCLGITPRKVEQSSKGVPFPVQDQQTKQPFCKEVHSVECGFKAVNISYANKQRDNVQKNSSRHEHKRFCRLSKTDIQLQRRLCTAIEAKDIPFGHKQCKTVQGNGCRKRERDLRNRASKCEVCNHMPFMQSKATCHSALELHSCHTDFSALPGYSDSLCRASLQASCQDLDRCHHRSSCKSNCSGCSYGVHSRSSELYAKSRSCQGCNRHVQVGCHGNFNVAGSSHKERNCMRTQYQYSAESTMCGSFNHKTRLCAGACGLDGDTFCYNGQLKCCGCHSLHCKEYDACSFDCLDAGSDCLVSPKGESIDFAETNELSPFGNCNLCAGRPSKSSKKVSSHGKTIIVEEVTYNSMQRAVREIYLDAECGRGVKEDLKVKDRRFPSTQVLLLENLEKDVTPLDVLGIIHQATCGLVQVYISPSYEFERFTRGLVCFEDQLSMQEASAFLQNEDIFIASSNGRPWVVLDVENGLCDGAYGGFTLGSKIAGPSCGGVPSNKIKIFHKGTPEYEKAKHLKGMFLELREHFILLHRRLGHEEGQV